MSRAVAIAAIAALVALPSAGGAAKLDYAGVALNILPPGQSGDLLFPPNASDQLRLYDGLTPRFRNVRTSDLTRYFKSARFGVTGKAVRSRGSSYYGGWYGYLVRDLRASRPMSCGAGDRQRCRASLWTAIHAAGSELAAAQGPDLARWRADATAERLTFGFLPMTARWTNRPTFQPVITFTSHRGRR